MKSKVFILSVLFVGLMLSSACSLDEKIYGTPTTEDFIKSEDDVAYLVNSVYENLAIYGCYKTHATYLLFFTDDNMAATNVNYNLYSTRTVPTSNAFMQNIWGHFYTAIKNANIIMDMVEKSDVLKDEFKKRIIGELKFMRGFIHFELVRLYGPVPIQIEPINGNSDFYPARDPVDEVYAQIFEDLKEATESCIPYSRQPLNEAGRGTKGAAQGIYALANLTYASQLELNNRSSEAPRYYQLAVDYADSVLLSEEYSLIPSYADLFDISQENAAYAEVIFGIRFTRDPKAADAGAKGSEYAQYLQPGSRYNICGRAPYGQGVAQTCIQPWFYDLCTTGDYENDFRSEVNFLTRWQYQNSDTYQVTYPHIPDTEAGDRATPEMYPYIDKYQDPDGMPRNHENDYFFLRLAEVYLIKAEALNELNNGPTEEAYTAFNKIRERARNADGITRTTPPDLSGSLSKEEFRLKVFDERGLELFAEGKRWYDNVRMRYTDNKRTMIEYRYDDFYKNMSADEFKLPTWSAANQAYTSGRVYVTSVSDWTTKYLIWPVPAREIDRNPNITQLPDYGW